MIIVSRMMTEACAFPFKIVRRIFLSLKTLLLPQISKNNLKRLLHGIYRAYLIPARTDLSSPILTTVTPRYFKTTQIRHFLSTIRAISHGNSTMVLAKIWRCVILSGMITWLPIPQMPWNVKLELNSRRSGIQAAETFRFLKNLPWIILQVMIHYKAICRRRTGFWGKWDHGKISIRETNISDGVKLQW
jgi:hypothetical protein